MVALLLVALASWNSASEDPPLREFQARLGEYVLLHRTLEAGTPPRVITRDPAEIRAASDALAAAIVAARPDARQGDIFTPAAARVFRERILLALAGLDLTEYLDELYEGGDFRSLQAVIHGRDRECRIPSGLPPALLWALPELPEEIEYRIVGRDLALWDEHAAMIVDFIPNAFPEQSMLADMPSATANQL